MSSTTAPRASPGAERQRAIHDLVAEDVERAFRDEELAGLQLATRAQLITLAVVAGWLLIWVPPPRIYFLEAVLALFAGCAVLSHRMQRSPAFLSWRYLTIAFYAVLLTVSMVGYDVLFGNVWPVQMMLRNGTIVYFFVLIAIVALSYSPQLVVWAGVTGAISWSIGLYVIARRPETIMLPDHPADVASDASLAQHLDPHFLDTNVWTQDVIVILIVAGILAAGVWRSRQLVVRQAVAARERANLARYFSPRIVDALARADEPLDSVRRQPVAVLFADVVGFTRLSEQHAPEEVIALLRELHGRLEAAVFEHDGTLDKYLGDGVMATFGTPATGPRDAANALACARGMLASVAAWNRARAETDAAPVRLSVGVHYGDVVLGDIGPARRLEFAVIGDVVNVASRLESLTRRLDTPLVVSEAVIGAIRATPGLDPAACLADLREAAPQAVRGRQQPVAVWALAERSAL